MDAQYLLYVLNILPFGAAITATIYLNKYKASQERYFIYFLWFTLAVEFTGIVLRDFMGIENIWLYNLYMLISFLFYYFWYFSILQKVIFRRAILIFSFIFVIMALWNLAYQSWSEYHQYTFVLGAMFTLFCTLFHFWQLLYSDEVLNITRKLSFWISTGLLLFNMGMIPLMLLSEYFNFTGVKYYLLTAILNIILYGCYIIGFLWTKEKYNHF